MTQPAAADVFSTFAHRDAATESIAVFEHNVAYQGAAFREVARAHLAVRDWNTMAFEAQIVAQAADTTLKPRGRLFEAIAEQILRRLVDHRFNRWPTNADTMIEPMISAMSNYLPMQGDVEPGEPARC